MNAVTYNGEVMAVIMYTQVMAVTTYNVTAVRAVITHTQVRAVNAVITDTLVLSLDAVIKYKQF